MRKSFYSLSGIVTNEMKRNVQDGEAFIFVNRSLTSMKILHAEYASIQILGPTSADLQVAILPSFTYLESLGRSVYVYSMALPMRLLGSTLR